MRGPDRQQSIYVAGVSGNRPLVPTDATHLQGRAEAVISEEAFAYIAGGAGSGSEAAAGLRPSPSCLAIAERRSA